MYDFNSIKNVKKENVQKEILKMMKSRCFNIFYVCKCPVCKEILVSLHYRESKNKLLSYFICFNCGKKFVKEANYVNENYKDKLKPFFTYYFKFNGKIVNALKYKNNVILITSNKNKVLKYDLLKKKIK